MKMRYFFLLDDKDKRHIVVATSDLEVKKMAVEAGLKIKDLYELTSDTYSQPGFLISDK